MPTAPDTGLPIEAVVPEVVAALSDQGRCVLTAEPGAGKTTVVPLRLLGADWLGDRRILVLEPRRVAARAVARRMAELLGEPVGATVGWRTRDDRRVGPDTRIEVVTEGILTRRIQHDPELGGVGAVLFDEFHERSIHADLGLALTIEAREALRPDLRLLVMSATIDAEAVAALLGGDDDPAPVVECPGRTHPVDVVWRPMQRRQRVEDATADAVTWALATPLDRASGGAAGDTADHTAGVTAEPSGDGDVLAFLPGMGEIRRTIERLQGRVDADVLPLYGALDAKDQDAALRAVPGRRRVVVATDVAETSLTVDGITTVVDAGLARRPRYDPATGLSRLVTVSNSKSSADQRAGRAGRLRPGRAVRLWSKVEHAARPRHEKPEILDTDLAPLLLESLAWGVPDPRTLRLLDPPGDAAIAEAAEVLALIDAVDDDGRITDAGRRMLTLPVHPRLAAMLDGVGTGPLAWPAAILAALLTERDVIGGRPADRPSDLWPRVQLVADRDHRVPDTDVGALHAVRRRADELLGRVGGNRSTVHPGDLGRTLALAYPDRLAQRRRGQGGRFRLRNGMGGEIDRGDALAGEDMIVVADLQGPKRRVRIARAAAIDSIDVELGFASEVADRSFLTWDDERDDLRLRVERRLGSLDFGTVDQPVEPSDEVTAALVDRIVDTKLGVLPWTERTRQLQARVAVVEGHRPGAVEPVDGPIDDASLLANAPDIFGPWLPGATGRADLDTFDLLGLLRTRLGASALATLDRMAPERFDLPAGRSAAIDYAAETPRISVRAQAVYGLSATPMLLDGALPLTVELLSPADRPIQVTADLAGFWTGSWVEVRKEMAGRYPKHHWPTDPAADDRPR
ncbi:MAG: ATP-dependent helicase HrpB [Actinomycetota bacterium]